MAYGLIRVRNLHMQDLHPTSVHNARLYDELGIQKPENIKGDVLGKTKTIYEHGAMSIEEGIKNRLKETGVTIKADSENKTGKRAGKTKKTIVALEYVVSASNEVFKKMKEDDKFGAYQAKAFLSECAQFIINKHGLDNLISVSYHFDESNPHAHVIVTPVEQKEVKWKNRSGNGTKIESRLCARDFTGGKEKLRQLQQEYFEYMQKQEKNLGVKFYRGTLAEDQKKKYVKETDHVIGVLRSKLSSLKDDAEKAQILEKIEQAQKGLEQKTEKLNEQINKHDQKTHGKGWEKGRNFDKGF